MPWTPNNPYQAPGKFPTWGDHVIVMWNLDKADRWKGGRVDSQILELSEGEYGLGVCGIVGLTFLYT